MELTLEVEVFLEVLLLAKKEKMRNVKNVKILEYQVIAKVAIKVIFCP